MRGQDSPRWIDPGSDIPAALREALRDEAADGPSPAQLERMITGVESALRADVSGPGRLPHSWIALSVVATLGLGAWGAWVAWPFVRGAPAVHEPQQAPTPAVEAPQPSTAQTANPPAPVAATQVTVPQPSTAQTAEPPAPAPATQVTVPQPSTAQTAEPPARAEISASAPPRPLRAEPADARARSADRVAGRAADPGEEVRLLRDAKRALASSPSHAETLLAEHRRKFPRGDFIEEREALQVEVDWQLGHEARARARAVRFRMRYSSSPYLPRIEHVLQGKPVLQR